jgi:hypothetical protein
MSFGKRLKDIKDIIILSEKPTRKEFLFSLRLATLGILIVGSIAFIINSLMSFIFHP